MKIERVDANNVYAISKLHIEVEQQTYGVDDPEMIVGNSELSGRKNIWNTALRNNCIAFLIYNENLDYPVGMISGYINFDYSLEIRYAKLSCIYVLRKFQCAGYGRKLLSIFIQETLRSGTTELRSVVPANNRPARNFFSSMGGLEHDVYQITLGDGRGTRKFINVVWNNISYVLNLV